MKCIAALLSDYSLNCYSFQVHFILQSFLINHKFICATLSICFCHYLHFHVKHILCRFRLSCIQSRRNLPWRLYWRYYCIDNHICLFCAFPEAFNVFPSIAYQKRKKKIDDHIFFKLLHISSRLHGFDFTLNNTWQVAVSFFKHLTIKYNLSIFLPHILINCALKIVGSIELHSCANHFHLYYVMP